MRIDEPAAPALSRGLDHLSANIVEAPAQGRDSGGRMPF